MKKSSLLALSLASLVALVGCGKDGANKVSGEKFDEALSKQVEKLEAKYEEDPEYDPWHYYGLVKYSYSFSGTGAAAPYAEKFSVKFHIIYGQYGWEPYPVEGDAEGSAEDGSWTEDDYDTAYSIMEELFYFDQLLNYVGMGAYLDETYADNENVSVSFTTDPFSMTMAQSYKGEEEVNLGTEEEPDMALDKWSQSRSETYTWNKLGESLTYTIVEKSSEKIEGHKDISYSYTEKESYSVKYLELPEELLR